MKLSNMKGMFTSQQLNLKMLRLQFENILKYNFKIQNVSFDRHKSILIYTEKPQNISDDLLEFLPTYNYNGKEFMLLGFQELQNPNEGFKTISLHLENQNTMVIEHHKFEDLPIETISDFIDEVFDLDKLILKYQLVTNDGIDDDINYFMSLEEAMDVYRESLIYRLHSRVSKWNPNTNEYDVIESNTYDEQNEFRFTYRNEVMIYADTLEQATTLFENYEYNNLVAHSEYVELISKE